MTQGRTIARHQCIADRAKEDTRISQHYLGQTTVAHFNSPIYNLGPFNTPPPNTPKSPGQQDMTTTHEVPFFNIPSI